MAQPPIDYGQPEPTRDGARTSRSGPLGIGWGWWTALVAIVITVALVAAFVLSDGSEPTRTVGVASVVTEPAAYEGDRVVISGRIQELLTDRVMAVGSDLASEDLLVLIEPNAFVGGYGVAAPAGAPLPAGTLYEPGDVVQFAGTIRDFDRDVMSDQLGLVLNDELFDTWDGGPALVVDRLDVATVGRLDG